eukprot:scaffold40574_cov27-Tisochrysis_lutea.AAC.17
MRTIDLGCRFSTAANPSKNPSLVGTPFTSQELLSNRTPASGRCRYAATAAASSRASRETVAAFEKRDACSRVCRTLP